MSTLISRATGNFTDASTWALCSVAAENDSEASAANITTANSDSATFVLEPNQIDAFAIKFNARPGTNGTASFTLRNSTTGTNVATVTINVIDVDGAGWHVFPLGSNHTPNGTDSYLIRAIASVSSQISFYTSGAAAGMTRQVRRTATQAPVANDKLIIAGEHTGAGTGNDFTVTMNETATTSYGPTVSGGPPQGLSISRRGTLTFATNIAAYLRVKGVLGVYASGTLNIGASSVARIAPTSSAVLEFGSAVNVDSGLSVFPLGAFNANGDNGRLANTLMTADKAAGATVITVASTAGWQVGDELAFASTTRTAADCEKKTILTVDSATQVTLSAGLTNARSGTSPTQAEVINLTRNVKIRGITSLLQGYCVFGTTSNVNIDSVEFTRLGSVTANKRGIDIATTTGACVINRCSSHDSTVSSSMAFNTTGVTHGNWAVTNCVIFNVANVHLNVVVTTGLWTADSNVFMRNTDVVSLVSFADVGGVFTNNTVVGGASIGLNLAEATSTIGTISGNTIHSNAAAGISCLNTISGIISGGSVWRHNNIGISLSLTNNMTLDGITIFGNVTSNIQVGNGIASLLLANLVVSGDTSFATTNGVLFATGVNSSDVVMESCTFGVAGGIKTAHTNDLSCGADSHTTTTMRNCLLASTVEVLGQTNLSATSYIRSQKHDQTPGLHKAFYKYGTVSIDTSIFDAASPSVRVAPNNASNKLAIDGGANDQKGCHFVPVASGGTVTVSVRVRKINENKIISSQDLSSAWTLTRVTLTPNAITAPDSTLSAGKLVETAVANTHSIITTGSIPVTNGGIYTLSCYAKAGERNWVAMSIDGGVTVSYFDVANGVTGTVSGSHTATILPVGNGWYRCSVTMTMASGTSVPVISLSNANGTISYLGDVTKGLYVWGVMLEANSSVTDYLATSGTAQPAYNGNQPRLIVRKNTAAGIASDTVLATAAAAAGTWETLSGTTVAVTDNCVLAFTVDCDGTAGWVNIDNWAESSGADTHGVMYWADGTPFIAGTPPGVVSRSMVLHNLGTY